MAELNLEPYAVIQIWHLPGADNPWESILADYLLKIAQHCSSAGKCVIGHIKALALFPDNGFLRVSVIAENISASVDGNVPAGCTELELTLNVLVYGLNRATLERITLETATQVANELKGDVKIKKLSNASDHHHHAPLA